MNKFNTTIIVGSQWGDEGKGKIADILSEQSDMVVRYQGGNNAGHTIVQDGNVYKLHLIPSGILYKDCVCVVGCGTVVNAESIIQEMKGLTSQGISVKNLYIDSRAHLIMPYHIAIDKCSEAALDNNKIGTTNKGIGPAYMDKTKRGGIRACDLLDIEVFKEKLSTQLKISNDYISKIYGGTTFEYDVLLKEFSEYTEFLKPHIVDTTVLIHQAIVSGNKVLFEGAQGTLLDLDIGTYPYVTSSHPTAGGACTGTGVGPTYISEILGISKAYTTRVGSGPFLTELFDDVGKHIQTIGNEVGTTTGRTRRVGWLDTVILRYAVRTNGCTGIALNKLDTLTGIKTLKIATSYTYKAQTLTEFPADIHDLAQCTPNYIELPGWTEDLSACTKFDQLPKNAQNYITTIEKEINCPITMIGVGPDRKQSFYK